MSSSSVKGHDSARPFMEAWRPSGERLRRPSEATESKTPSSACMNEACGKQEGSTTVLSEPYFIVSPDLPSDRSREESSAGLLNLSDESPSAVREYSTTYCRPLQTMLALHEKAPEKRCDAAAFRRLSSFLQDTKAVTANSSTAASSATPTAFRMDINAPNATYRGIFAGSP